MNENEEKIDFRFTGIEILSKTLNYKSGLHGKDFKFYYDINADSKVNPQGGLVLVLVLVNLKDEEKNVLASLNAVFTFEIIDFDNHIKKLKEGLYHVPDNLDIMFRQVSISTMRGLMYSELRDTYLSAAIMPVIFPTDNKNTNQEIVPMLKEEQIEKAES